MAHKFSPRPRRIAHVACTIWHISEYTAVGANLGIIADMNAVYATFFKENPPARTTVQVAALPKGASIEIEAVVRK